MFHIVWCSLKINDTFKYTLQSVYCDLSWDNIKFTSQLSIANNLDNNVLFTFIFNLNYLLLFFKKPTTIYKWKSQFSMLKIGKRLKHTNNQQINTSLKPLKSYMERKVCLKWATIPRNHSMPKNSCQTKEAILPPENPYIYMYIPDTILQQ